MNSSPHYYLLLLILVCLTGHADVVINEFVADNETVIQDEDGDFSDWIELKNDSQSAMNLSGWYLTDNASDLTKWEFPSTTISANGYLVVFASSKDRAISGSELHTNFKLSAAGEYLALIQPDGATVASEFTPTFPPQLANVSYGIAEGVSEVALIADQASCSARVPTDASEGNDWQLVGFNDSLWEMGITGVGYDTKTTYDTLLNLDLDDMRYQNSTAYVRIPFSVVNSTDVVDLTLRMKCDDGFVAYLNGVEVASANAPTVRDWQSQATTTYPAGADEPSIGFLDFDISEFSDALLDGVNMLAIHALNDDENSSDLLVLPELNAIIADSSSGTDSSGYLAIPTPGAGNSIETTQASEPVLFSQLGAVFSDPVQVELFATNSADIIYYTLDGSDPTTSSSQYTAPLSISSTTNLRARSFEAGFALGPINSETYIFLDNDVKSFSSNLPIIVLDNLGVATSLPDTDAALAQPAILSIFEPGTSGRTSLTDSFTLSTRSGIARRGETSLRTVYKPNLSIETWGDGVDDDVKISPLGMPPESDWILWAPWETDPTGIRNALIYEFSNQTGNYAVRTRFVEVFMNLSGDDLSIDDYAGFYVLMEKVKRGSDRVDIDAITPLDNTEPNVTGGYMLAIDKGDANTVSLSGMQQRSMQCNDPRDITTQQKTYIQDYIINFEAQRWNSDPETGYPAYIDEDSFVDFHMLNMLARNADGLRISTFMSKPRSGKLAMGPIWDFDRSQESGDGRDNDPTAWTGTSGTLYFTDSDSWAWWQPLFSNADLWQRYIDNWQEHRMTTFSSSNVTAVIEQMAEEVAEAMARDIVRWTGISDPRLGRTYLPPRTGSDGLDGTQQGEINHLKWWWTTRLDWIDPHFVSMPVLSQTSGTISGEFQLSINSPSSDTIYYTLDGSDPRSSGGSVSASAVEYTGSIIISPDTIVCCRAWDGTTWSGVAPDATPWSGLTTGIYYREDLLLTEVHYNPRKPASPSIDTKDAFEFIELQNTGSTTLDLTGYSLDGGIEFSFAASAVQSVAPGNFVVIVNDLTAFTSRYDTNGMNIAGSYTGKLSNGGENIRLEFHDKRVYDIEYNDTRGWPAAADGGGHSLIPVTNSLSLQGFDSLDYSGNWRASAYIDGSPGESDPDLLASIMVNEVIAHTDTGNDAPFDSNDVIEIYNPTAASITLDGFWYLSDDVTDPEKWKLPSGTVIAPGAWISFDEDDFHAKRDSVGFGLNKGGEQVVLSHRPGGGLDRIVEAIEFAGQANGASWGRYPDGNPYFQTLTPTAGSANQLAADGIQITELMYNPPTISDINADEMLEYIQLTNTSAATIALKDLIDDSGSWRLDGGVNYTFESGISMSAGEVIWIVPFNPIVATQSKAFFCSYYGLDVNSVRLIGPYSGDLSDSGERITLERPQASDTIEVEDLSWIIVDEATWMDETPWPINADGTGLSLLRIGVAGNAPESWTTNAGVDYNDRITYEKVSPGTSNWNAFSSISNLSDSDYADANSLNGVTVSIVAGTNETNTGAVAKLLDGLGQNDSSHAANSVLFTSDTTTARVLVDLQSVQPVYQINTYSWHSDTLQNQVYDLYYSAESTAPASTTSAADSVALIINGWVPLGSVDSDFNTDTSGQIGASWTMASAPLDARYFLFDIKAPQAYWGEIDILTAEHFVVNGVPKAWLTSYGLPTTDPAALLDSDEDGQLNWQEYYAGTNPLNADSVFKITQVQTFGMQLLVHWQAVAGKTYTIEYKADLTDSDWTPMGSGILGVEPESSISAPINGSKGFIRVSVDTQ